MTEQETPNEGTDPRCLAPGAADNRCPHPATRTAFGGDGPPEVCEFHTRLWALKEDLAQAETAQRMLVMWQEQAGMLACPPLEDAVRFVRDEGDLEVARLRREIAELREEERAGG